MTILGVVWSDSLSENSNHFWSEDTSSPTPSILQLYRWIEA